jgi:hypothetical protein
MYIKIYNVKEKLLIILSIIIIPPITFKFSNRFYYQNHKSLSQTCIKFSYNIYLFYLFYLPDAHTHTRVHARRHGNGAERGRI